MSKGKVLTKKDCRTAAKRWLIGISTFNYETQLAPSYAFAVYPHENYGTAHRDVHSKRPSYRCGS